MAGRPHRGAGRVEHRLPLGNPVRVGVHARGAQSLVVGDHDGKSARHHRGDEPLLRLDREVQAAGEVDVLVECPGGDAHRGPADTHPISTAITRAVSARTHRQWLAPKRGQVGCTAVSPSTPAPGPAGAGAHRMRLDARMCRAVRLHRDLSARGVKWRDLHTPAGCSSTWANALATDSTTRTCVTRDGVVHGPPVSGGGTRTDERPRPRSPDQQVT